MKKVLMASVAVAALASALPVGYADANAGGKLYIAITTGTTPNPQNTDLSQVAYEALVWLEVKQMGSHGETGTSVNVLTYDTWDTTVAQKAAGIANAGDPEIELARLSTDPGQIALRTAASAANRTNNFAFKLVHANGTVRYNRGIVLGPRSPNGRNEDFILEVYTFALNQEQITAEP